MKVATFFYSKHVSDETLSIFSTAPASGCEINKEVYNIANYNVTTNIGHMTNNNLLQNDKKSKI